MHREIIVLQTAINPQVAPDCWYCIYSTQYQATSDTLWEPGEPAYAECNHELHQARQEEDENPAPRCPGFIERMVGSCPCGCTIHQPEASWPHWACDSWSGEAFAVCSVACKERIAAEQAAKQSGDIWWSQWTRVTEDDLPF